MGLKQQGGLGRAGVCKHWGWERVSCGQLSPFPQAISLQRLLLGWGSPEGCSWQTGLRAELTFAHHKYPLPPQEQAVLVHPCPELQSWGTLVGSEESSRKRLGGLVSAVWSHGHAERRSLGKRLRLLA